MSYRGPVIEEYQLCDKDTQSIISIVTAVHDDELRNPGFCLESNGNRIISFPVHKKIKIDSNKHFVRLSHRVIGRKPYSVYIDLSLSTNKIVKVKPNAKFNLEITQEHWGMIEERIVMLERQENGIVCSECDNVREDVSDYLCNTCREAL